MNDIYKPTVADLVTWLQVQIEADPTFASLPVESHSILNQEQTRPACFSRRHRLIHTDELKPKRRIPLWDSTCKAEQKGPAILFVW